MTTSTGRPQKTLFYCKSLDKSSVIPNSNNSTQLVQQLSLQLRCNDLDIYNKGINLYKMSKYYSYIFYADRNVRPCMILGYTLTTFPKSRKTLMHNQSNRDLWHNCKRNKRNQQTKLHLNVSRRTLHNWWGISGQQVSTQQGKTEQK